MERKLKILLIEDNPADAKLTAKLLAKLPNIEKQNIAVCEDGQEALSYLNREGEYSDVPYPDIMFLDLNLPVVNGLEVLSRVKADPLLRALPVIILSSSVANKDLVEAFRLNVTAYIRKPVDLIEFQKILAPINEFWFEACLLPNLNKSEGVAG